MKPFIITLTGPSCAGKTTLESHLRNVGFAPVISTTTREMRVGERNGGNYYYITRDQFLLDLQMGMFVESVEFGGNLYGVSVGEIERVASLGSPIVMVVEPHGQKRIVEFCKKHDWNCYSVFVNNPPEVIAHRFLARMRDDLQGIKNHHSVLMRYAERMGTMMTVERKWVEDAANYDLVIDTFGLEETPGVVRNLISVAQQHGCFGTKHVPSW